MGWIAFAAAAAVALQAGGQIKGGIDAKKTADYNAAVAKQEAKFQEQKTEQDLAFQREEVESIIGKARTVAGGRGLAAGEGVTQSILKGTLTEAAIDEELIRTRGAINVWRAKSQASLLESQGEDFRTAGFLQGGSTILGGIGKYDYRRKKETPTKPKVYRRDRGR
jgi:hypothetical protein